MRKKLILFFLVSMLAMAFLFSQKAAIADQALHDTTVFELLPKDYVKGPIHIEVKNMPSDKYMGHDLCESSGGGKRIFARTIMNRITVSKAFMWEVNHNFKEYNCGHRTFQQMYKAVILHEITHVKDYYEGISSKREFRYLFGEGHHSNKNKTTSPEPYEFTNLKEALATNAEYMLLDPEYECRRPAMAEFMHKYLGFPLKRKCSISYDILLQSEYVEENYRRIVNLNPDNIDQIHYLWAGQGKGIGGYWGHAMIRIVACDPEKKKKDPKHDCLGDTKYHTVISYRASPDNVNPHGSYFDILMGKHPMQLFIFSFQDVRDNYTKIQFRDLYNVPLKLSKEQIRSFIHVTLERYWNYQGRYYLLDNNCGSEARHHMLCLVDNKTARKISGFTPLSIYGDLEKIIRKNEEFPKMKDKLELKKRNLYYPSVRNDLKISFEKLKGAGFFSSYENFDKFLKESSFVSRVEEYGKMEPMKTEIIQRIEHLERYFVMKIPKLWSSKILDRGEYSSVQTYPWMSIHSRYGNPLPEEFRTQKDIFEKRRKMNIEAFRKMMISKREKKEIPDQILLELDAVDKLSALEKKWHEAQK